MYPYYNISNKRLVITIHVAPAMVGNIDGFIGDCMEYKLFLNYRYILPLAITKFYVAMHVMKIITIIVDLLLAVLSEKPDLIFRIKGWRLVKVKQFFKIRQK